MITMTYVFRERINMDKTIVFILMLIQSGRQQTQKNQTSDNIIIKNAVICSQHSMGHYYRINNPRNCKEKVVTSEHQCNIKAFAPKILQVPLKAHICTLKETRTEDTYYFWGEKISVEKLHRTYAPSEAECKQMVYERKLDGIGFLKQKGKNFASTNNKKEHNYQWCRTMSTSTKNAYWEEVTVFWDLTRGTLQSHLFTRTDCEFIKGSCKSPEGILIWKPDREQLCSYIQKKEFFDGKAIYYNNSSAKQKAIIIRELEMTIYDLRKPHHNVTTCFGNNTTKLSSETGFLFIITNCTLKEKRRNRRSVQTGSENPDFVATQMNFLSNQHNEDVETLHRNFNYILCQIQNEIQFNQKLLSQLYPSEVLSRYLKAPRDAAKYGDVIIEKTCKRASVALIRSLQLDNESYAIRPVAYYTIGNKSKIVQHKMGNVWQIGTVTTKLKTTGFVNFEVDNMQLTYLDSELVNNPLPVKRLSLTMEKIEYEQPEYDFEKSTLQFARVRDQSIQTMITNLEVLRKYENYDQQEDEGEQRDWESEATNLEWIPIKHPVWTVFITITNILSHLWAIVWTIIIIIILVKGCKRDGNK